MKVELRICVSALEVSTRVTERTSSGCSMAGGAGLAAWQEEEQGSKERGLKSSVREGTARLRTDNKEQKKRWIKN